MSFHSPLPRASTHMSPPCITFCVSLSDGGWSQKLHVPSCWKGGGEEMSLDLLLFWWRCPFKSLSPKSDCHIPPVFCSPTLLRHLKIPTCDTKVLPKFLHQVKYDSYYRWKFFWLHFLTVFFLFILLHCGGSRVLHWGGVIDGVCVWDSKFRISPSAFVDSLVDFPQVLASSLPWNKAESASTVLAVSNFFFVDCVGLGRDGDVRGVRMVAVWKLRRIEP